MQAYYANAIPLELLQHEQQRITNEVATAQVRLARAEADLSEVEVTVEQAVGWAQDAHASTGRPTLTNVG